MGKNNNYIKNQRDHNNLNMNEEVNNQAFYEELVKEEDLNIKEIDEVEQIVNYGKTDYPQGYWR